LRSLTVVTPHFMKFALRQLVKSPGFSVIALLTLALGIGINTTAFTVLNRLLLQSLPYADSNRLVQIWATTPQTQTMPQSPGDFFDEKDQNTVFEHVAVYYANSYSSVAKPGQPPERFTTIKVSGDFLPMMGVVPTLGRVFTADEEAHSAAVVLLGHAWWLKNFAGDPKVLGTTLRIDGTVVTIVGVMPPAYDDPQLFGSRADLWSLDGTIVNRNLRDKSWYQVAARLKPGISIGQAQAEMTAIAARLAHDFPKTNAERSLNVVPFPTDSMGDIGRKIVWLIMDLALVVLLIACVNLANLQLVRTTGRAREFAIRLALGASRRQLTGMLLTESLLLSVVGGALGLLVAKWGNSYLAAFFEFEMPLNFRVLGFAFAASAVTGVIFGTLPAWIAARSDVNQTLKQSGRGNSGDRSRHRLRRGLIVIELSLALILLTGAGYFIRGIERLTHHELGWRTGNLLVGFIALPHDGYGEENDPRSLIFTDKFRAGLQVVPGVEQAVVGAGLPAFGLGQGGPFLIADRAPPLKGKEPIALTQIVSQGFFDAFGMHLIQGRDFTDADRQGAPHVVIINQAMAQKFWPGESPLGKRIGGTDPANPNWSEIIGVTNNISAAFEISPPESLNEVYRPWAQNNNRFLTFAVHSAHDPRALEKDVRKVLAGVEPNIAITYMATAEESMASNMGGFNLVRRLLVEIAALGLLLSAVGIYGVIANLVSERTQEVGIRMALGAQASDVRWLFLRSGIRLALIGTGIGVLGSFGLMRLLAQSLAIVPGNDPWVIVAVAALLIGVALLACWLPAWRATKVSPLIALRAE
jgi:putative ABC transport system permease protein